MPGDQDGADCVEEDVADDDPIDNDDLVSSAKNYVSFLGNAIAIGLRGPEKKKGDLLDNCIAVSVALLLESERVWLDTVKIGLLISSIETLLGGDSKGQLTDTISRNVATLCCKPKDRLQMK